MDFQEREKKKQCRKIFFPALWNEKMRKIKNNFFL